MKQRTQSSSLTPSDDLDQALNEIVPTRAATCPAVVRESREAALKRPVRTVSSLAEPVIGSVEGPEDLSTGRKHIEAYGR